MHSQNRNARQLEQSEHSTREMDLRCRWKGRQERISQGLGNGVNVMLKSLARV